MTGLCVVEPLDTFITPSPITRFLGWSSVLYLASTSYFLM